MAHADRASRGYGEKLAVLLGAHLRLSPTLHRQFRRAALAEALMVCTRRRRGQALRTAFRPDRIWHHQIWADGAFRGWVESRPNRGRPVVLAVSFGPLAASIEASIGRISRRRGNPLVRLLRLRHPRLSALLLLYRTSARDEVLVLESRSSKFRPAHIYPGRAFVAALALEKPMLGVTRVRHPTLKSAQGRRGGHAGSR